MSERSERSTSEPRPVYVALVHHPVRDRAGQTVTTAITNLDVHDLARTCRTYDLAGFFVVTPVEAQRRIARAILDHWGEGGAGRARVPERSEALARCAIVSSVEEASAHIARARGGSPRIAATAARSVVPKPITPMAEGARLIGDPRVPWLILFGTGHGLADALIERADVLLPPIRPRGYNHLSVRAAAAIVLDRLFGEG